MKRKLVLGKETVALLGSGAGSIRGGIPETWGNCPVVIRMTKMDCSNYCVSDFGLCDSRPCVESVRICGLSDGCIVSGSEYRKDTIFCPVG